MESTHTFTGKLRNLRFNIEKFTRFKGQNYPCRP
ncbi:hypothetical protein [Kosakonia oryziphila]